MLSWLSQTGVGTGHFFFWRLECNGGWKFEALTRKNTTMTADLTSAHDSTSMNKPVGTWTLRSPPGSKWRLFYRIALDPQLVSSGERSASSRGNACVPVIPYGSGLFGIEWLWGVLREIGPL
jgi:hypothetical protein